MRRDVPAIRPTNPTPRGDAEWFAQSAGRTRATLRGANHQSAIRNYQLQAVYEYDVYGQVAASDPNHPNRFLFTGREFDTETGLYYYRARYYNPTIGRFLQTDPIGYNDGMNCYAYCRNNPLNIIDPSGLLTIFFYDPNEKMDTSDPAKRDHCMFEESFDEFDRAIPMTSWKDVIQALQELSCEERDAITGIWFGDHCFGWGDTDSGPKGLEFGGDRIYTTANTREHPFWRKMRR